MIAHRRGVNIFCRWLELVGVGERSFIFVPLKLINFQFNVYFSFIVKSIRQNSRITIFSNKLIAAFNDSYFKATHLTDITYQIQNKKQCNLVYLAKGTVTPYFLGLLNNTLKTGAFFMQNKFYYGWYIDTFAWPCILTLINKTGSIYGCSYSVTNATSSFF